MLPSWVLLLAAWTSAVPDRAPLALELCDCAEIERAVVVRVLSMELGASPAEGERRGPMTTARAECRGSEVRMTIDDPITGKTTTRLLDLAGYPRELRARMLGQAISEAVLASWIELEITPAPALPRSNDPALPEIQRQVAHITERHTSVGTQGDARFRYQLSAGPTMRGFGSGLTAFGLTVMALRWLYAHPSLGVGFDMGGDYGEQSRGELGRVNAMALAVAPRLLMRGRFGPVEIQAGAGWRAGLARLEAQPLDSLRAGRAAFLAWTGPFLDLRLLIGFGRSSFVSVGIESGRVLLPAAGTIEGTRVVALDGSWLGGVITVGTKL